MARAIPPAPWWPTRTIKRAGGRLIAVAALFMVLGISAIAEPAIAQLPLAILTGWLLTLGGVTHLGLALSGSGRSHVVWQVILGTIYILGGALSLTHPLFGVGKIILLLSLLILMEGTLDFIAYFRSRNENGSVWLLVNGLITLMLGGLISIQWPFNSARAIGTLVGLNLLTTGFSRLMLGTAFGKPATRVAGSEI